MDSIKDITKPFLKWAGGKSKLLPQIDSVIDKSISLVADITYVEPFVGGGAVLFFMLRKFPNIKRAIINDVNEDLINAYRIVKESPMELISYLDSLQTQYRALDSTDKQRQFYLQIRTQFNDEIEDNIVRAGMLIFLNRTCFNGLYRVNKSGKFNVPFGNYKNPLICDKITILADSAALKSVEILCGDFSQTLIYASDNTFFYFDPPYKPISQSSSFTAYTLLGFDDDDQFRLKKFCDNIYSAGAKFILSNSDVYENNCDTFFDDLYQDYKIDRVFATRAIGASSLSRGQVKELLINNLHYEKANCNYGSTIG